MCKYTYMYILNTLRETTGAAPIRSRTSCAKPGQTYIKYVPKMLGSIPKSTKIVTSRGPKSMKICVWMGLCPLFVVSGALGREYSGKLGGRCAKLGQDGSKLRPRWATMASRWPSWSQLWRLWGHLGADETDFDPFFTSKMRKMEFSWNTTRPERGSPRIRCQAPQNRPSPSTRKGQDDGR